MLCILCMTTSDHVIPIFEEQGLSLDVSSVIVKHFWLQPNQEDENAKVICSPCWNALDAFHKFYERVQAAHLNFLSRQAVLEEELKLEDHSEMDVFDACSDFLPADVKLEVKEDGTIPLLQDDPLTSIVERKIDSLDELSSTNHSFGGSDSDSDSDLEIPLAALAKREKLVSLQLPSEEKPSVPLANDKNCATSKKKVKVKNPSTTSKGRTKRARHTKEPTKSESENRVKRKILDPVKKRELSQEFDEIIRENMKLSCSICEEPLDNFFLLRKHYQLTHNERGYATCCGRKFRKRGVLVDHIYLHQNPEYFKCLKCQRVMADRRSLEVHMKTHDTSKQRIYQCDECNKSFYRKLLLNRHMYTHIPDRKFNCSDCGKLFSSEYTLRQHRNNVHNSTYMKICDQCGKSFRGLEAFRRHQLEHSGGPIPLVQCEKCGVKLTNKYGLKRHMDSMHPEVKIQHVCQECGKRAPSAAALQRHTSYMHKCQRIHQCPMCSKAFKKAGNLRVNKNRKRNMCTRPPVNQIQFHTLKPSAENANNKVICSSCWNQLDSFHKFYQKVEDAHSKLISSWSAATIESTDILSAAIRIAGIKPEPGEDSDGMETSSSSSESDYEETDDEMRVRQTLKRELDQVIRQHIKLKCNICQEPMRNFTMLKRHFESVHNESGYVICCKLKFRRRNALADHIYLDHNQIYLCDKCGQVMADCRALNVHKATHTNCSPHVNVTSAVTVRFEKTVQTCNTERN